MYINAVVSFIDIMGFRDLVKTRSADEVKKILDLVASYATEDGDEASICRTVKFSDSVIRVAPVDDGPNADSPVGIVFHEFLSLVHAQAELMNHGVLMRGGVSFGEVAIGDDYVFGPAFVAAYDLESKFANYSRIVVDPHLLSSYMSTPLMRASHHSLAEDKAYIRDLICHGDDGIWFIDYAKAIRAEMDEPMNYPLFLQAQKNVVLEGLKSSPKLDRTLAKYFWLAQYHNHVARLCSEDELRAVGLDREKVLLSKMEMSLVNPLKV